MAWNKSSNYKVDSSALLPEGGFVGDMFLQSGAFVDGVFQLGVEYVSAYDKPAVSYGQDIHYYEGMGAFLTIKERIFSNGFAYKMPAWSNKPLCSTNFPNGVMISGFVYTPLRLQLCNAGINYTVELLGRVVS